MKEGKEVRVEVHAAKRLRLSRRHQVPRNLAEKKNEIGIATGLAWTEVGGQVLTTEATLMQGKGRLTLTGKLGDVMQESGQAAMSYVRSRAVSLGLSRDFYRNIDIHIHVPKARSPKMALPRESPCARPS